VYIFLKIGYPVCLLAGFMALIKDDFFIKNINPGLVLVFEGENKRSGE